MAPFKTAVSVLLVAVLALSAQAYVDPSRTYVFFAPLTVQNLYGSGNQNTADKGFAYFTYAPSSMTLSYWLYDNLSVQKTSSALNGPSLCYYMSGGNPSFSFDWGSSFCYQNTAPQQVLLSTLPSGPTISSVTLTSQQEDMLFDNEMYVIISSTIMPAGHIGGHIYLLTLAPMSSAFLNWQTSAMYDFAFLGGNNGQFPNEASPGTSATGIIYLWYYLNNQQQATNVYYTFFHSLSKPGVLTLKCPNVGLELPFPSSTNGVSAQQVQFKTTGKDVTAMIPELFQTGNCYFKVTSAANPNGEIYGRVVRLGAYEIIATGQSLGTSTADFVSCMADYDQGSKVIGLACYSNITTDSVSSVQLWDTNSNLLICNVTGTINANAPSGGTYYTVPNNFYCQVNATYNPDVTNGKITLLVTTTQFQKGAVQGTMNYNTNLAGYQYNSGGLSQAGVIAIAVIFSVLGAVIIAGLVFFAYRKGFLDNVLPSARKV